MSNFSDKKRRIVYNKYNGHCAYCGIKLGESFTIDHIKPVLRKYTPFMMKLNGNTERGTSEIENLNPCCHSCNSSKHYLSLEQWRESINNKWEMALKESSNLRLLLRFGMIKYHPNFKFYFEKINK